MTSYKERKYLNCYDLRYYIEELAWAKIGFRDADDIRDKVRSLPLEKKMEMLTEIFIDDLARIHLEEKQLFIETLGGTPAVTEAEIREWASENFPDSDEVEYKIDIHGDHYISSEYFTLHQYSEEYRKRVRKRGPNWKHNFLTERKR